VNLNKSQVSERPLLNYNGNGHPLRARPTAAPMATRSRRPGDTQIRISICINQDLATAAIEDHMTHAAMRMLLTAPSDRSCLPVVMTYTNTASRHRDAPTVTVTRRTPTIGWGAGRGLRETLDAGRCPAARTETLIFSAGLEHATFLQEGRKVTQDATPAPVEPIDAQDSAPMRREPGKVDALPIVTISLSSLLLDELPWQGDENDEHTRMVAGSGEQLLPIVVHGPSMRVIEGIHRVNAAIMRGEKTIAAKIYHGRYYYDDAALMAVRMNIAHGLP